MTCALAMISPVISITVDMTVADAMAIFEQRGIRGVPVVDDGNRLAGLFTIQHLLRLLLPEAAIMENHLRVRNVEVSLDNFHDSGALVAVRLKNQKIRKIGEVMIDPDTVRTDTPLREGLRLLEKFGSPIPVIADKESRTLAGVITSQSVIRCLNAMKEAGKAV